MKTLQIYLTLLISCTGILQVFLFVTATAPKINFAGLPKILISGQYNGISEYSEAPGQKEIFDKVSGSLIAQSPNGTFLLAGTTSDSGTINALCVLPRSNENIFEIDVYVGGNFSTLGGITVNNIALYDPSSGKFSPLIEGLDGPVNSLYCDTTNSIVYVGGTFVAPINQAGNLDFAGNVAVWRNNAWEALPFKGFNGPVYTIARNEPNNTIYFGGQFDATGDGLLGVISNQPINMRSAVINGGNSADREGFGNSSVVVECDEGPEGPGTTWLMRDSITGFWRAEFKTKVSPTMIGIKNTNYEGRGTKTFRLIAISDSSVVTLSYMDPIYGFKECSTRCPLSPGGEDFQRFTFVNQPELTGIQIDILDWYGPGGGLHRIQLFQSDVVVHAASDIDPSCSINKFQPKVTHEGVWTTQLLSGIWRYVLQTTIPAGELTTSTAKVVLQPYIPQAGYYHVVMFIPSCVPSNCSKTTSIDVTIKVSPGTTIGPKTISQSSPTSQNITLYDGFVVSTTTSFQPTVEIKVSTTAVAPAGGEAIITVDQVRFEKMNSSIPLSGLFKYNPSNLNAEATWGGFNGGVLPQFSTVYTIKVLSPSSIVIGGKFNNFTFFNIVEYDGTTFIPFPNRGLNGQSLNSKVNTLERVKDVLLIGGLFSNSATIRLNNIAKLSLTERNWFPLSGGVNGEVEKITLLNDQETQQVHVAGKFNTLINPQSEAEGNMFGNVTFGYTVWDDELSNWVVAGFIDGNISDIAPHSVRPNEALTFHAGEILAAQSTTAFGGSFLTDSGISALPLYPQALNGNFQKIIINSGLIWDDAKNVIIGGKFALDNNITNVAILRDGLWNNLGNDITFEGEVKCLILINELIYIGSAFKTEEGGKAFVIYDLSKRRVTIPPQLTANDNDVKVNVIKSRTTSEILVGGKFDRADSLECKTICIWDSGLTKWKTLGAKDVLSGEIFSMDLIGKSIEDNSPLIVAGNLALNGKPVYLLKYDFSKSSWEDMGGSRADKLPGPAAVVSNDFMMDGQFFVSGYTENGSAYLRKWTGDKFGDIGEQIKPDSRIEALNLLPTNSKRESVDYLDDNWLLLVSGSLKLDQIGDVGAALYDGKNMYPYILSPQVGGVPGRISAIFPTRLPDLSEKKPLPIPIVILISTFIAMSFIFIIIASGMTYRYLKRKRQAREPIQTGLRDSVKTPIRDSELMATINAATAIIGQSNNRFSMTSSNNLRNSVIGSNADVRSLDEAAMSGLIGSGAIGAAAGGNQTSTLQNTSIEGERNSESNDSAALRSSMQLHPVVITPAGEGQVLLNGKQAYTYKARYPFVAREEGELGFNSGEEIFVTDTSDEVWWFGWKKQNEAGDYIRGVFPSNYVIKDQMNPGETSSSVS